LLCYHSSSFGDPPVVTTTTNHNPVLPQTAPNTATPDDDETPCSAGNIPFLGKRRPPVAHIVAFRDVLLSLFLAQFH
jgi:hypothetical protein